MDFTIKTSTLQDMVSKVIVASSDNKLLPMTSLIELSVKDNKFTLTTTDLTNYFYVSAPDKVDCEDFEFTLIAQKFITLIKKSTSETARLYTTKDNSDHVQFNLKTNGDYILDIAYENNDIITFPKHDLESCVFDQETRLSTIKILLQFNRSSLSTSSELPAIQSYYCGDTVLTSDGMKACRTDVKLFDKPILITPQFMDILGVMTEEKIEVAITDDYTVFKSGDDMVYAPVTLGIETFPVKPLNNLIDNKFSSSCKVPKDVVLSILDRMLLFVSKYDQKSIYLIFTPDGLIFRSKKGDAKELLPYVESENFVEYQCLIQINRLRDQVNTQSAEFIDIAYGNDTAIKINSDIVTQVVALMADRVEG